MHDESLRESDARIRTLLALAVVGSSLAIVGAAVAVLTAAGLYASDWDFRPQDRSEAHWQLIVQCGTAGLVIAGATVASGALVVGLVCLRSRAEGAVAALVGPVVSVVVAGAVAALAVAYVVPAIQHFEVLSTHTALF